MEGCQEEEEKGVQSKKKIYPHLVRPCIGYGLSDDDGDVVDADECEREGVKYITLLELGINIREEEESAFDPAELGSELCPEAPLFKAEQLGESGGGGAIIPKELGIETPGSNTGDILADKQLEEEEVPVILDAAAAKETAEGNEIMAAQPKTRSILQEAGDPSLHPLQATSAANNPPNIQGA